MSMMGFVERGGSGLGFVVSGGSGVARNAKALCSRRSGYEKNRALARPSMAVFAEKSTENGETGFFSKAGFQSLGLSNELAAALEHVGICRPTNVQTKSIPAISGGADVVVGAATGSGKTLSYLLPVLQKMKDQEQLQDFNRVPRRPRAILLVPTRELAEQVLRVSKSLSHNFKFRAVALVGGNSSLKKQKEALSSPVDLVIATAGRLMQHVNAFNVDFLDLQYIILDEVDTLFEGGFANDLESIVTQVRKRKGEDCSLQFIAAGATHPTSARQLYTKLMPSAKYINVDLHKAPPGLTQRFIHTTPGEKTRELTALLGDAENDGTLRGGRIIIFTNTTESCRFLDHFLNEKDYSTSCIHGEMPRDRRGIEFQKFADRKTQLLVGTDVAARGLDNLAVDHVILFDFPASPVDYIHRAGRTARAGAKGRVSSFITKKDRTLAEAIEQANKDETDALAQAHQKRLESDRIKAEKGRLGKLARARMEKERGNQGYGKNTNDGKDHRQGKGRILKTKLSPKRR